MTEHQTDAFNEWTPTERAAALGFLFAQGAAMSTAQIADHYNITHSGAYRLTNRIARAIPLINDGGVWRVMSHAPPR